VIAGSAISRYLINHFYRYNFFVAVPTSDSTVHLSLVELHRGHAPPGVRVQVSCSSDLGSRPGVESPVPCSQYPR
jgi:hypothetical protein